MEPLKLRLEHGFPQSHQNHHFNIFTNHFIQCQSYVSSFFPICSLGKLYRNPKKFPHPPIIAALRSTLSSTSRAAISRSSASFPSGPVSSGQSWNVGSGGSCNQTWHTNTLPTKGPEIYMSTGLSLTILNYHPLQCVEPLHLPPMAPPKLLVLQGLRLPPPHRLVHFFRQRRRRWPPRLRLRRGSGMGGAGGREAAPVAHVTWGGEAPEVAVVRDLELLRIF